MTIDCEMTIRETATPEQLTCLGAALWQWCYRASGGTGIYQYLDNQALADLVTGKFPASIGTDDLGGRVRFQDVASQDRLITIDRLRRELPVEGIADITVDGHSWNHAGRARRALK